MLRLTMMLRHLALIVLLSQSVVDLLTVASAAPPQTPNLLEIVLGRCYERHPAGNNGSNNKDPCPVVAPDLIAILQGSLDHMITPDSFERYWRIADFSCPVDKAIFVIGGGDDAMLLPPNLVRPEDTPGGALMKGLVFCGVDAQQRGCDFGSYDDGSFTGAQASFWAGAYEEFAQSVTGKVRIVVGDHGVKSATKLENQLVTLAAVPTLKGASSVDIYSQEGCDLSLIEDLTKAMDNQGIKSSCTVDPQLVHLLQSSGYLIAATQTHSEVGPPSPSLPGLDDPKATIPDVSVKSSGAANIAPPKKNEKNHHTFGIFLFLFLAACAVMVAVVMRKRNGQVQQNYEKIPQTVYTQ